MWTETNLRRRLYEKWLIKWAAILKSLVIGNMDYSTVHLLEVEISYPAYLHMPLLKAHISEPAGKTNTERERYCSKWSRR